MAGTARTAHAVWTGSLAEGSGTVRAETSGAFGDLAVDWKARTEDEHGGATSPEELLAAAHAACFSMALSHALAEDGHAPDRLEVSATVTFEPRPGGGFRIASSALRVRGQVPGIDDAAFQTAAQQAGEGCPVSGALKGNVQVEVEAELG
ncbi:MAG: OsmC family peroxiredoxin [Longimicrobiales bacterium]